MKHLTWKLTVVRIPHDNWTTTSNAIETQFTLGENGGTLTLKMIQLLTYLDITGMYLFAEYAYLWELQTLLPVKQVRVRRLHRSSGKLLPNANYGAAIYRMQEV
jgi:hypothetical protein